MSALNIYLLRFKKPTMSLTAMARENALLERSTESNSAPSGTGIDLGDPAEYLSWHHDRLGTLGWERANEGCETPVVSQPSFACPGSKVADPSNSLNKSFFQSSVSNLQTCGENVSPERIRSGGVSAFHLAPLSFTRNSHTFTPCPLASCFSFAFPFHPQSAIG